MFTLFNSEGEVVQRDPLFAGQVNVSEFNQRHSRTLLNQPLRKVAVEHRVYVLLNFSLSRMASVEDHVLICRFQAIDQRAPRMVPLVNDLVENARIGVLRRDAGTE